MRSQTDLYSIIVLIVLKRFYRYKFLEDIEETKFLILRYRQTDILLFCSLSRLENRSYRPIGFSANPPFILEKIYLQFRFDLYIYIYSFFLVLTLYKCKCSFVLPFQSFAFMEDDVLSSFFLRMTY